MCYTESEKGEIRADLTAMYLAGRKVMPERAQALADAAKAMAGGLDALSGQTALLGHPRVLSDLHPVAVDCCNGAARAVLTFDNMAEALVVIANAFKDRDDYAAVVFKSLEKSLTTGPVHQVPVPPTVK